jgi:DNA transformation protein and related proteins
MAANAFHAFAQELFSDLGLVSVRRMFGGAGIYADGVMFALIDDDTIYIKADEALKADLRPHGSVAWTYTRDGEAREMGYWRLPESALDDRDEAALWARRALLIARAKPAKKKPRATRR